MGLKEQIDGYTQRVDAVATEIRSELQTLNDRLAAASAPQPIDPAVQSSLDTLGSHLTALEGVEQPSVPATDPGSVGGTTVVPPSDPSTTPTGTVATDSPGEPTSQTPPVVTGDPTPAGDLPPETSTVPTDSVDSSGTVDPTVPVTPAGNVPDPTTPVVPVTTDPAAQNTTTDSGSAATDLPPATPAGTPDTNV